MSDTASLQSVEAGLESLLEGVPVLPTETLPCERAARRVLPADVTARLDVPPFDNSAMDGYALRHTDAGRVLPVSQRIVAGASAEPLAPGSCARIFTGGAMPQGADCVVRQENAEVTADGIRVPDDIPVHDNVRHRGSDVRAGTPLLSAGMRLDAAALGHLAGQGITEVEVRRRPRVALLSTGDEIVEPGQPLKAGQIYNSNRPMLIQLLETFGAEVTRLTSVPDEAEGTRALLSEAAQDADVVITTGGVSVGEEDHVKTALESLGRLDLWKLAMRPGKPLALGRLPDGNGGETRFVGLPGNPVSSFVAAWLFLRPLMGALLDCPELGQLPRLTARADFSARTGPRRHYMRVTLTFSAEGIVAQAFPDQNSGVLSSCVGADALAIIEPDSNITAGDSIDCLWLRGD
ncbi:gephyrin-like molybdotransferase Glp [Halomonas elongata]|uniref:Molybdopterin molybdenumtransferase n=1 Tax=Halomonas elongata (strain ATCC 33173 / DSM 2581 / NBRC 15536 / NCIMB 2198 / 1H9) TaxID=768066 RepID=E1V326_HALED|nr:gephyrin-like molybdotransferase Glp [Halomonas elongata]MBW5800699.1 molybdopterin molybdotransferase MoeA [Halomonas elongata]RAW07823.1 molybdopterin molybdenumtransferase MoeA [Halomonas elongata]WBF19782.1 molybdopterin molybdotransferase MoeA [Halomonas elongata]WPU48651.1 gephyrin-like molybdotransferase Glp [Halomonas elongata DSM 2581]WVI73215.1 gephyrin-like molybdotransferase Glp [Halomonas elongata]